jgi:hypothetical protein
MVGGSVLRQDDFLLAAQAHRKAPSVFFDDYRGHIQVVGWATAWLADRVAPLEHWPLAVLTLAMQLTASLFGWIAIRKTVGPRPAALLGLAVLLFSPLTVGPLVWAAAAVQLLTLQIAIFASILAYHRAIERGTTGAIVSAWLVFGIGLLANEKALVIPPILMCLIALSSVPKLRTSLTVDRTLWLGYLALMGGEVVLYISIPRSDGFQPLSDLGVLFRDGILGTWLTQITATPISGSIWAPLLNPPPTAGPVVATIVALIVVLFMATRTGVRGLAAVGVLLGYVAAEYGTVAITRLGFGNLIAIDPRYVADTVPVAGLCLAIGVCRLPTDRPWRIGRSRSHDRNYRIPSLLVCTTMLLIYGICALPTTLKTARAGRAAGDDSYISSLRREVVGRNLTIVDGPLPNKVVSDLFGNEDALSNLVSVLPGHRRFTGLTATPLVVDEAGRLRPAAPGPGSVKVTGPDVGCGWPVLSDVPTQIAASDPLVGRPGLVEIGYVTGADTPATFQLAGQTIHVALTKGLGHLSIIVDREIGQIAVSGVAPFVRLCVSDVTVGPAAPTER